MNLTKREFRIGAALVVAGVLIGGISLLLEDRAAVGAAGVMAPRFEVDPLWPKPLPNHWLLGTVIGVDVDADDNVWIVHRGSSLDPK